MCLSDFINTVERIRWVGKTVVIGKDARTSANAAKERP
jgi:hypothetical protein